MNEATAKLKISARLAERLGYYGSSIGNELPEADKRASWASVVAAITPEIERAGGTLVLNRAALDELADYADWEADMVQGSCEFDSPLEAGAYKAMMLGLWSRCCKALAVIERAGK